MRYRLIGVDLDGTLLDKQSRISAANMEALERARSLGVVVAPCTGRSWPESRTVVGQLPGRTLGVFVGGASIAEVRSGRAHDLATIEPEAGLEVVRFLWDLPEAVLLFQDEHRTGRNYLVTGAGRLTDGTRWWFESTGVKVEERRVIGVEDLRHTLRIGIVAGTRRTQEVGTRLREEFAGRFVVQSFEAVQVPEEEERTHVMEIFAAGVDKWRGLMWIGSRLGIAAEDIAAIGDEVNDVAMVAAAGCGIAMGNAKPAVKAVARYTTLDHDRDGVAHAIHRLLDQEWT